MKITEQTPTEELPYTCNIEPSIPDVVVSATWSSYPAGLIIGTPSNMGTTSTVLVSGVQPATTYLLRCHIVGNNGKYDGTEQIFGVVDHL